MAITIPTQVSNSKIVSWTLSSDEEVVQALQDAYNGTVDLEQDYGWCVGQERSIHLAAMDATGVSETHPETDVMFVLLNKGGYTLVNGSECQFIVGMKHAFADGGYMNSTNTNSGSWESCTRRHWCNGVFYNAVSETIRPIFKQFNCVTGTAPSGTGSAGGPNQTTQDYFALAAEKEVFGTGTYSTTKERNVLTQFSYYTKRFNIFKTDAESSRQSVTQINGWWFRSPSYNDATRFCYASPSSGSQQSATYAISVYVGPGEWQAGVTTYSNPRISVIGCI